MQSQVKQSYLYTAFETNDADWDATTYFAHMLSAVRLERSASADRTQSNILREPLVSKHTHPLDIAGKLASEQEALHPGLQAGDVQHFYKVALHYGQLLGVAHPFVLRMLTLQLTFRFGRSSINNESIQEFALKSYSYWHGDRMHPIMRNLPTDKLCTGYRCMMGPCMQNGQLIDRSIDTCARAR